LGGYGAEESCLCASKKKWRLIVWFGGFDNICRDAERRRAGGAGGSLQRCLVLRPFAAAARADRNAALEADGRGGGVQSAHPVCASDSQWPGVGDRIAVPELFVCSI